MLAGVTGIPLLIMKPVGWVPLLMLPCRSTARCWTGRNAWLRLHGRAGKIQDEGEDGAKNLSRAS